MVFGRITCSYLNRLYVKFINPIIPVALFIPTDLTVKPFMLCSMKPNTCSTLALVFDEWMAKHYPDCPFERYADDAVIHVKNEPYARQILKAVRQRMEECKLELHPEKTKLVYCKRKGRRKKKEVKHQQFDFLGFNFRPRKVMSKYAKLMYGFSPSISKKNTKLIISEVLGFALSPKLSRALSSKIRGWINYYGKFHLSGLKTAFLHLNRRLAKWAFNKYKHFKRCKSVYHALRWIGQVARNYTYLFPHWKYGFTP